MGGGRAELTVAVPGWVLERGRLAESACGGPGRGNVRSRLTGTSPRTGFCPSPIGEMQEAVETCAFGVDGAVGREYGERTGRANALLRP